MKIKEILCELPYIFTANKAYDLELEQFADLPFDEFKKHIEKWLSGQMITSKKNPDTHVPAEDLDSFIDELLSNTLFVATVKNKFVPDRADELLKSIRSHKSTHRDRTNRASR